MRASTPARADGARHLRRDAPRLWRGAAIYPFTQVLAWSVLVAWSVFVSPPPDPKFVGWAAFWIGALNISALTVPVASVSHIAGLALSINHWGPVPRAPLFRMHFVGGLIHPILLQLLGAALHALLPSDDLRSTVFGLWMIWAIAGPAAVIVALSWLSARRRDRVHVAAA